MNVIDPFGNHVNLVREMWNDLREDVDCRVEWEYKRAKAALDYKYLDHDAVVEESMFQEVVTTRFVEEIVRHLPGTPCSVVYNDVGEMVGGYNADGVFCNIGELVL